jgi:hypothetical protein
MGPSGKRGIAEHPATHSTSSATFRRESMDNSEIQALVSQNDIERLIHSYPRGLDRLDRSILLSIAHESATVDFPPLFKGTWIDYVEFLMNAHTNMLYNRHSMSNIIVEIKNAGAVSETSATAHLIVKRDDGDIEDRTVHTRYLDSWRQDSGRWSLAHRRTIRDFRQIRILSAAELASTTEYANAGKIGRQDPSYAHFAK